MRLSARNTLAGTVRKIEVAPSLELKVGDRAYAVIKASSVMIGVD